MNRLSYSDDESELESSAFDPSSNPKNDSAESTESEETSSGSVKMVSNIILSNNWVICLLEKLGILVPYPTIDQGCPNGGIHHVASVFDRAFHTDKIVNRPCKSNIFFKILWTVDSIILRFYAWKFWTKCTMIKFYLGSIFINTITPPNGRFCASIAKFRAICKPICPWGQRGS